MFKQNLELWPDIDALLFLSLGLSGVGFLCFLAGMASLLKARKIAQAILLFAALLLLACGALLISPFWFAFALSFRYQIGAVTLISLSLLVSLAGWLGRQQDSEG